MKKFLFMCCLMIGLSLGAQTNFDEDVVSSQLEVTSQDVQVDDLLSLDIIKSSFNNEVNDLKQEIVGDVAVFIKSKTTDEESLTEKYRRIKSDLINNNTTTTTLTFNEYYPNINKLLPSEELVDNITNTKDLLYDSINKLLTSTSVSTQ